MEETLLTKTEKEIAEHLLQIGAIKLQPKDPFTWSKGWKSPIYCDNRKTISYPEVRRVIRSRFKTFIQLFYPEVEVIAGVATGAIPHAAWLAEELDAPMVYVRQSEKGHGMGNKIEGDIHPGQKLLVIEDLISTGGSSIDVVYALRNAGYDVLGLLAIFTYGFEASMQKFKEANCEYMTLSNYGALLPVAIKQGLITEEHIPVLSEWSENPADWRNDLK